MACAAAVDAPQISRATRWGFTSSFGSSLEPLALLALALAPAEPALGPASEATTATHEGEQIGVLHGGDVLFGEVLILTVGRSVVAFVERL